MKLKTSPVDRIHILPTKPSIVAFCKNTKTNYDKVITQLFNTHIKTYLQSNDEKAYIFDQHKTDKAKNRYLMEGEKFIWKDIEFRVMKCEPCNNGLIDLKKTQIFCSGEPINDIKSVSIRPLIKSEFSDGGLPLNHQDFTSDEIKNFYLKKYFYGLSKFLEYSNGFLNNIIRISDVEFMIYDCDPLNGIITCSTNINNSSPIRHWEIQEIQTR
eukprot:373601_1